METGAGGLTEGCETEFWDTGGKNDPCGAAGLKDLGMLEAEGPGPGDDTGLSLEDPGAGAGEGTSAKVSTNSVPIFLLGTGLGNRDSIYLAYQILEALFSPETRKKDIVLSEAI